MPDVREGTVLWQPSPERRAQSRMADYMRWLAERKGLRFDAYQAEDLAPWPRRRSS